MPKFQTTRKVLAVLKRPAQRFLARRKAKTRGLQGLTADDVSQLKDRVNTAGRQRAQSLVFGETARDEKGRNESFRQTIAVARFLLESRKEDVFNEASDIALGLALDRLGFSQRYDAAKRAEIKKTFRPFVDRILSLYKTYEIQERKRIPEEELKSLYREVHENIALLVGFNKALTFLHTWDKNMRVALRRYKEETVRH